MGGSSGKEPRGVTPGERACAEGWGRPRLRRGMAGSGRLCQGKGRPRSWGCGRTEPREAAESTRLREGREFCIQAELGVN